MSTENTPQVPSERARHILRVLVEQYIRDGQPVGSRTLSRAPGLSLSPATIRNVMADLEEMGYIASPHTSAGRVPTPRGYRVFVDTLVKLQPVSSQELKLLQQQFEEQVLADGKSLAAVASSALSALTSMAGVVTIPRPAHVRLRQIEFIALSERRVLAILVGSDGEVQNRVLHMERDYSNDELRRVSNLLNERFSGLSMDEIRSAVLKELKQTRESMNQLMLDSIAIAGRALDRGESRSGYVISGETKLMDFEELSDIEKLRALFEAFSQQREILHLLDRSVSAQGVQIFIGEESGYRILDDCSLVAAPYSVNDEIVGVLGVIGPTRMAYERVIPIVDITARLVGAALNSSQ